MTSRKIRLMRILIVEQDEAVREQLGKFFSSISGSDGKFTPPYINQGSPKYEVHSASKIEHAIKSIGTFHPDAVLIGDCGNIESSKALCERIRREEKVRRTGIIFLAPDKNFDDMSPVECLEIGADDYIFSTATAREMIARVEAVLRLKSITDELRAANHQLEILSMTDDLTGLRNMRAFNNEYSDLLASGAKRGIGIAALMLDLDHFKSINDSKNHLIGSFIIGEVGKLIRLGNIFPEASSKARYGGDEYIVAYHAITLSQAQEMAEKLRKVIESAEFTKEEHKLKVTSSVGVAWVSHTYEGDREDLIKAADMMLYKSKRDGRNRVSGMVLKKDCDLDLSDFSVHVDDLLQKKVPVEILINKSAK